jgi:hypothetical protein
MDPHLKQTNLNLLNPYLNMCQLIHYKSIQLKIEERRKMRWFRIACTRGRGTGEHQVNEAIIDADSSKSGNYNLLTYFMEQSPSLEANSNSVCQEVPRLL